MAYENGIDAAFVKQYGKTLDLVAETKGGKFVGLGLEDTIQGEEAYYDQLGSTYLLQKLLLAHLEMLMVWTHLMVQSHTCVVNWLLLTMKLV
jgi:hypothetical protein